MKREYFYRQGWRAGMALCRIHAETRGEKQLQIGSSSTTKFTKVFHKVHKSFISNIIYWCPLCILCALCGKDRILIEN